MDKIFNLKIDTKNKNITTVTGLKQFDNNSILNITLLQNSLALDLSNCTVRINFLREDERVLLYMADIVSPKEGKVIIKLSPEVLEKAGLVKADISVFDSNLLKITSATFNLRIEKSVYNDTYFTDKDLDLMQQEYVRENERQKAENARAENELARITKEGQRNSNENTRISNEEARKKAEDTRVAEWNNVKKDATNIKNTLDTTIDTANTANNNLKNTIATGDKLKEDLTPQNYVKNSDYEAYKKEANSQYEETAKKIKEVEVDSGTWTPTIVGSESPGEIKYRTQFGYYKKIGKRVFIEGWITVEGKDNLKGKIIIGGLPFKAQNKPYKTYGASFSRIYNTINIENIIAKISDNHNFIELYNKTTTQFSEVTEANITNTTQIAFSTNYEID